MKPSTGILCVHILQNSCWRLNRNSLETLSYFWNASFWSNTSLSPVCCAAQPALQWMLPPLLASLAHYIGEFSHPNLTTALFSCLCSGHQFLLVTTSVSTSCFLKADTCFFPPQFPSTEYLSSTDRWSSWLLQHRTAKCTCL